MLGQGHYSHTVYTLYNIIILTLYNEYLSIQAVPSCGAGLAFVLSSMGCPYRAEFQCAYVSRSTVISRGFLDATTDDSTVRACPLH